MVRALTLALALTLTGCASTTYVTVPCVKRADIPPTPDWLSDTLPPDASPAEVIRSTMSDLLTSINDAETLRAILGACAHE